MKYRIINLKSYPIYKARKAIKRLHSFVQKLGIKIRLIFILPYYKAKKMPEYKVLSKSCPYCGSFLKKTDNGVICSQDKLKQLWRELQTLRNYYGDNAEVFLTAKQNRFYDMFLRGERLTCDYCQGNDEAKWRKGPLY